MVTCMKFVMQTGASLRVSVFLIAALLTGSLAAAESSWQLQTPAGDTVMFPAEREGPTILFFWASWCPYCKAFMPHLQALADENPDLSVLAINFRDDGDPQAYLDDNGYSFTLLLDGGDVADRYEIWATPGLLLFDRDNQLVFDLYAAKQKLDEQRSLPDGLSHGEKAARKAPWWAHELGAALAGLR